MSDLMLHAVLEMPPDLWSNDFLDVQQRHARYKQASELIRRLRAVIDELPEEFEGICRYSKGEFNFVDFSEPTTKSSLLAKHGVEAT